MKTADAEHNRNHPQPFPRPGVASESTTVGGTAVPMDEAMTRLGWTTTQEGDTS